ncbi:hypothetical protein PPH41_41525, partial [Burkholderia gladioli]|nr:hypothetical protein [Burkholderia gladioli]
FSFNGNDLSSNPGFQFASTQGLKSVQNQMAARGLGYSGAGLAGRLLLRHQLDAWLHQQGLCGSATVSRDRYFGKLTIWDRRRIGLCGSGVN